MLKEATSADWSVWRSSDLFLFNLTDSAPAAKPYQWNRRVHSLLWLVRDGTIRYWTRIHWLSISSLLRLRKGSIPALFWLAALQDKDSHNRNGSLRALGHK